MYREKSRIRTKFENYLAAIYVYVICLAIISLVSPGFRAEMVMVFYGLIDIISNPEVYIKILIKELGTNLDFDMNLN